MENFARHMRICSVTVSDGDVNSRRMAATELAKNWAEKSTVSAIVKKAADVAKALGGDGYPSQELGEEIQNAIQMESSSYLYEERPLDVSVCAGMAMVSILGGKLGTSGWTVPDVYATALWSALSYQPTLETERRENLRRDVLDAATHWATRSSEKARERSEVPNPSVLEITIDEDDQVTSNFNDAIGSTIEALCRNAALDREELDFLWWAQLGRSRLLNKQLLAISEPTRIVAAGIEGAKMLRRPPCEVHREIVLRMLDQNPALDLAELLETIGEDRSLLCTGIVKTNVTSHPSVFPLLHALSTGEMDESGALVKRHVSEWGERALLEAGFARLMSQGTGKI